MLIGEKQPDGSIDLPLIGPAGPNGDKVGDEWDGFALGLMAGADAVPVAVEVEAVEVGGGSEVTVLLLIVGIQGEMDVAVGSLKIPAAAGGVAKAGAPRRQQTLAYAGVRGPGAGIAPAGARAPAVKQTPGSSDHCG
jgi:hypothetical protein